MALVCIVILKRIKEPILYVKISIFCLALLVVRSVGCLTAGDGNNNNDAKLWYLWFKTGI